MYIIFPVKKKLKKNSLHVWIVEFRVVDKVKFIEVSLCCASVRHDNVIKGIKTNATVVISMKKYKFSMLK